MPTRGRMHREIEIKLRISDLSSLFRQLQMLGARSHGRVFERNTVYDTPQFDFKNRGWLLRLRSETPARSAVSRGGRQRVVLTFKCPPPDQAGPSSRRIRYKERLEYEAVIEKHPQRWPDVLRSLSLHAGFRYEKYRTELVLRGLHMCLDETPVGNFLELEGPRSEIDRVARALGYAYRDYIQGTYRDLHLSHLRRNRKFVGDMVFGRQKI